MFGSCDLGCKSMYPLMLFFPRMAVTEFTWNCGISGSSSFSGGGMIRDWYCCLYCIFEPFVVLFCRLKSLVLSSSGELIALTRPTPSVPFLEKTLYWDITRPSPVLIRLVISRGFRDGLSGATPGCLGIQFVAVRETAAWLAELC